MTMGKNDEEILIKEPNSPSKPPKIIKVIILAKLKIKWDLKLGQFGEIESNKPPTTALQLERLAKIPRKKNNGKELCESRSSKGKRLNWFKRKNPIIKSKNKTNKKGLVFFWGWQSGQLKLVLVVAMQSSLTNTNPFVLFGKCFRNWMTNLLIVIKNGFGQGVDS